MSLEKHIFKTQESFLLETEKDLNSVKLALAEAGVKLVVKEDDPVSLQNPRDDSETDDSINDKYNGKTESGESKNHILSGSIADNKFEISESTNFLLKAFIPKFIGKIERIDDRTRISLISQPSWFMSVLLQKIGGAFIGSILALITSAYLLPNTISITYAFALTILLPLTIFIVTILIARMTIPKSVEKVIDSLKTTFEAREDQNNDHNFIQYITQPPVSQNFIAGILAAIMFLAIAFGLHNLAASYWMNGKYDLSAKLCHPVASIASAFLPNDSAAVADTKYYLAECLRCQGKLDEAKKIYFDVRKYYIQDIGEKHVYVADVNYALGRIFEEQGDLTKAKKLYKEALELWLNNDKTKKWYISLARIKNRLAVIAMKEQKPLQAKELLNQALKWDKRYKRRSYGKIALAEDSNDLAVADYLSGDIETAKKNLEKSIKLKKKVYGANSNELVASYINLSYVSAKLGLKKEATENLSRASKILKVDVDVKKTIDQFINENGEDRNFQNHPKFPDKLMEAFKKLVEEQNPAYEAPQFAARANILLNLEGRL